MIPSTPPRLYAELQEVVLSTMQRTGLSNGGGPSEFIGIHRKIFAGCSYDTNRQTATATPLLRRKGGR
jgi:hypothetical protein